jgi:DnaD/phage-associated family protein
MADIGGRRQWIKLHITPMLHGTTRKEMEPDERSVWYDFLCLAGDSAIPGVICMAEGVAFTEFQLAKSLNISEELLQRAVDKMMTFGKITLDDEGCFQIVNWEKYQGASRREEYMREYMPPYMRNYRRKKKQEHGELEETVKQSNVKVQRKGALTKTGLTRKTGLEETRLEKNREEETRVEEKEGDGPPPPGDMKLSAGIAIFEQYSGRMITPLDADTIAEWIGEYTLEFVSEVIAEAVKATGHWPGWKYCEKIAERWQTQGRDNGKKTKDAEPHEPKEYLAGRLGHLIKH